MNTLALNRKKIKIPKSYRNNISDGIALVSILKIAAEKALISSHHNVAKEPKYSFAFV